MALKLVEDDEVLEAALSLLEQPDNDDMQQQSPTDSITATQCQNKKKRKSSSNRAREAQYQELLALREQVPRLEKRLAELQQQAQHKSTGGMLDLWRKLALVERQSRANTEDENRRLRALVRENADATAQSVQQLLQTNPCRQEHRGSEVDAWPPERWPYRRMYAVPVDPCDGKLIQEMATSVDAVYRQVLQVYSPLSDPGSECPATHSQPLGNAHRRCFADKVLPFDVDSVADAAWQFFAHAFRRVTTRFYFHSDTHQAAGLVSDDTVVEIFGEEHRFGHVLLDIKIKQIVRRYVAADRVVVAWRALLSPDKFKTETLSDVVYEEKGALVIEPCPSLDEGAAAASVVHTWQMITPDIAAASLQSEVVQELTQFVLNSCRPGRAIQSMERTLRAPPVH